jgi:hypothetical protein
MPEALPQSRSEHQQAPEAHGVGGQQRRGRATAGRERPQYLRRGGEDLRDPEHVDELDDAEDRDDRPDASAAGLG